MLSQKTAARYSGYTVIGMLKSPCQLSHLWLEDCNKFISRKNGILYRTKYHRLIERKRNLDWAMPLKKPQAIKSALFGTLAAEMEEALTVVTARRRQKDPYQDMNELFGIKPAIFQLRRFLWKKEIRLPTIANKKFS